MSSSIHLQSNRLQWGRDRAVPEIEQAPTPWSMWSSFNGAGTARSRKCGVNYGVAIRDLASMGPGPRGPGNSIDTDEPGVIQRRFNGAGTARSRKFRGCEHSGPGENRFNGAGTARSRKYVDLLKAYPESFASMGPGPRGPGNEAAPAIRRDVHDASMGPGPRGPGNEIARAQSVNWEWLQWGRDRAVPEITAPERKAGG